MMSPPDLLTSIDAASLFSLAVMVIIIERREPFYGSPFLLRLFLYGISFCALASGIHVLGTGVPYFDFAWVIPFHFLLAFIVLMRLLTGTISVRIGARDGMCFGQALLALRSGDPVRRTSWPDPDDRIIPAVIRDGELLTINRMAVETPQLNWMASADDVLACDWGVYRPSPRRPVMKKN